MKKILKIIAVATIVATLFLFAAYAGPNYDADVEDDEGFFEMLSKIINDIADLPRVIAEMVGTAISALMESIALGVLKFINWLTILFFSHLKNMMTDANLDLQHSTVLAIFNVLRPTANTFAVLFLIIQVTKSAATFEAIDITRTMKHLLFFVLAIFFIDNSLNVLSLIVKGFGGITQRVLALGYGASIGESLLENFQSSISSGSTDIHDSIGAILLSIVLGFLVVFAALSLYITLVIRSIEILIMAASSCLFASTLASDATIDVFKSFMKNFVATVSSTLFMAIGLALFASISEIQFITGDFAYVDAVIKMTAVLTYCTRTPQTIRSILGAGSPAINTLSIAKSAVESLVQR